MSTSTLIYHPEYARYDFGPEHPLRPERLSAGLELLETAGLWTRPEGPVPGPATEAELRLVHTPNLIEAVQEAGNANGPVRHLGRFGIGTPDNPPFPGMHDAAALVAGGAVTAVRMVLNGRVDHAFHPAGGLHHAMRDRVSGFCVYNDPALAAAVASHEFGARVLYVDFDAHHGDGVQAIFYERNDVFTLSFHESGRYLFPATGFIEERGRERGKGYALNVPFEPSTRDEDWIRAVDEIVPAVAERFHPDIVLSVHGADTHRLDPLTHMTLTTRSFRHQAAITHRLAHEYTSGRWVAFGSGGYEWRRVVPRSWAILWSEMSDSPLEEFLPRVWLERWAEGFMPTRYTDERLDGAREPETEPSMNRLTVTEAVRLARAVPTRETSGERGR